MKELILILYDKNYAFHYCQNTICLDRVDTGFYGEIVTKINYNYYKDGLFTVFYGHKGYPSQAKFLTVGEVFEFIKSLLD